MIYLPREWGKYWDTEEEAFRQLFSVDGPVCREKDGRRTLRFKFGKKHYYGKFHSGIGWKKILKNILQFRRPPVLSAQNEWRAIQKLESLGIETTPLVGYGKRGWNPAKIKSFVITDELTDTISLEFFCKDWPVHPPPSRIKKSIIANVAKIARIIHQNGLNHRDFYICHFLLDISMGLHQIDPNNLRLFLIDLHRVQIRPSTPWRWRVKDISALLFSSMDLGLTKDELLYFASIYHDTTGKKSISKNRFFWWMVKKRAMQLYKKESNKPSPFSW